jgi:hypothetical protein
VSGIILPSFVSCIPARVPGCVDIGLLPLLGTAAQQDDQCLSLLAEIDPVAGAEIEPQFQDARADALCSREVATFKPVQSYSDSCLRIVFELIEPSVERIAA